jgi:hypothetical protein
VADGFWARARWAERPGWERALEYLRRADWVLVPVKGPEEGSVQALPALLRWLQEANGARLLGFLPTMHKPRLERLEFRWEGRAFWQWGDNPGCKSFALALPDSGAECLADARVLMTLSVSASPPIGVCCRPQRLRRRRAAELRPRRLTRQRYQRRRNQ